MQMMPMTGVHPSLIDLILYAVQHLTLHLGGHQGVRLFRAMYEAGIRNKHDSTAHCPICVHCPICCALKNVTPPPAHTFLKWPFLTNFKKYTHPPPPYVMTCFRMDAKLEKKIPKSAKTHKVGTF